MFRNETTSSFIRSAVRFGVDRKGIAAVEFALIAPMMLMLLFVSFELTDTLGAVKRAENTAASLADVVSRDVIVTDAEIDDVFEAVRWLVWPGDATAVKVRISSLFVDDDGQVEVVWSEGRGMSALSAGAPVSLPGGLRLPQSGIVMVETVTSYRPPLGLFSAVPFEISKTEYRRPRVVDPVARAAS
jgi:hypothetical protein